MKSSPFTFAFLILTALTFSATTHGKPGSECTWEFSTCLKVCEGPNCRKICEARHCDPMSLDNLICPVDDVVMIPSAASLAQQDLRPLPDTGANQKALSAQDKALAAEQTWDEGNQLYLRGLASKDSGEIARGQGLMDAAQDLLKQARAEMKPAPVLASPVLGSLSVTRSVTR